MGRPSKLNPERTKKFIDAIRVGATQRIAALYAGVTDDTIINWRAKYPEFAQAISEAEGTGVVQSLAKIEQAASAGDWRAAAWKLERRFPQEYGKQVTEIQGKDGESLAPTFTFTIQAPNQDADRAALNEGRSNGHVNANGTTS